MSPGGPSRVGARWTRLCDLPAAISQGGDDVEGPAQRGDVGAHDVDTRDLAVLDLGDAGLADAEYVGDLGLGQAGGLAHLGELVAAYVGFASFGGGCLGCVAFGGWTRVGGRGLGLDLAP